VNQQLRRRYFLTQKAKDAQLVGILVATLGVADHLKIIEHIKVLAKNAGKK
jgi:diphthamide biosynthesis protein 2